MSTGELVRKVTRVARLIHQSDAALIDDLLDFGTRLPEVNADITELLGRQIATIINETMNVISVVLDKKASTLFKASVTFLLSKHLGAILISGYKTSGSGSVLVVVSQMSNRFKSN